MPEKKAPYKSPGVKVIELFTKLLFSRESHSLTDLARMLDCSKQTVLRLVGDIRRAYGVEVEESVRGNRKYFGIRKLGSTPSTLPLTESELSLLYMCRAFAEHLLGKEQFEKVSQALLKTRSLVPEPASSPLDHFAVYRPGTIDYTPFQEAIGTLIEAMRQGRICRITYQATFEDKPKTYNIKPLKIFSHRDTMYLHARMARQPGKRYRQPDFDPLLAVHRIRKVELTEGKFEFPQDYDFEKAFNREFGIIKDETFKVQVEFSGWAARYVSERIWSPDQKIKTLPNGKILLTFTAASEPEVMGWVLSFGEEARVVKPRSVAKQILRKADLIQENCRVSSFRRLKN